MRVKRAEKHGRGPARLEKLKRDMDNGEYLSDAILHLAMVLSNGILERRGGWRNDGQKLARG